MAVVLLARWPSHETALMFGNEESIPISSFKIKFSLTCLFFYKSSPPPCQGPSPHSAFPQSIRTFPGKEKNTGFAVIALE